MKTLLSLLLVQIFVFQAIGGDLVYVPTKSLDQTKLLFQHKDIVIHFYCDDFLIGTLNGDLKDNYTVLDKNPWSGQHSYYIVYHDESVSKEAYLRKIETQADLLFHDNNKLIVKTDENKKGQLQPAKNDGMVRIFNTKAVLPSRVSESKLTITEQDPLVLSLLSQVSGTNLTSLVQHMQDYNTRNAYHSQSVVAQNWIKDQLEDLGLEVELMDFTMPSGPASDNVIATKVGTKYPNEFVIIGGHYDSMSNSDVQPGADDNASGTAAVMEMARILSQYEFDRTIVFCAFSGEEYGLYGSAAYASRCAQQGMNILGYFNLDMIGYLKPTNTVIKSTLIYPQSALELAQFYTTVSNLYLPEFVVTPGSLSGGDSDHTSFNNNGFMGIFPFEDISNYSPYIHTVNDLVGPSYNNEAQAVIFTKATLASAVTMANFRFPPKNLAAIPADNVVELIWDNMVDISHFRIYRNGTLYDSTTSNYYADFEVSNGTSYQYFVSAVFSDTNQESAPSRTVAVSPSIPLSLPFVIDFEGETSNWTFDGAWGISTSQSHSPSKSLTESPSGNYDNNLNISATFGPISLVGYTSAQLSFWTKYDLESNYDYLHVEISNNNQEWTRLGRYSGLQSSWTEKSYSLNNFIGNAIYLRFRLTSDGSITKDGAYIDDFAVSVTGSAKMQPLKIYKGWSGISTYLSPFIESAGEIVQPISANLVVLQDETNSYWPSHNVNTLGNWNVQCGYKIKVSYNSYLRVPGSDIQNPSVTLNEGWNILPVLTNCPVECSVLFSQVSEIEVVKEIASTQVYWPAKEIETLQFLLPGKAYYVLASEQITITFPDCETNTAIDLQKDKIDMTWELLSPSGNSHLISIPVTALQGYSVNDKIGVFTPNGNCAGLITLQNLEDNIALVAFESDSLSDRVGGFMQNDPLVFKLFKFATGEEINLVATFDPAMSHTNLFHPKGLSSITQLVPASVGITETSDHVLVYPNPAKSTLHVELLENGTAKIELSSLDGKILVTDMVEGTRNIELSTFSKGVYLLKIEGEKVRVVQKIIHQ